MNTTSDQDLLRLMHRGDQAAARELWSRLGGRLTALAATMLRHSPGASLGPDVVQGVFLKVLRLPSRDVNSVADVAAWLTTLVRRDAIDMLRKTSRGATREIMSGDTPGVAASAGPDDDLLRAIDALDEHQRDLIQLKHVAGLTFDQISLVLDENRETLASRYRVALQRVRQIMSERVGAARAGVGRTS
ncbi:MAG: RNA polymerase sigma factor [Phycisphaerales bacterium]|nr:RNA polymerase sigma factor [Phycisphaerales bacterium]